jgi:hypothetical protein
MLPVFTMVICINHMKSGNDNRLSIDGVKSLRYTDGQHLLKSGYLEKRLRIRIEEGAR